MPTDPLVVQRGPLDLRGKPFKGSQATGIRLPWRRTPQPCSLPILTAVGTCLGADRFRVSGEPAGNYPVHHMGIEFLGTANIHDF